MRNPFRYKGYYYDSETELYYCKSRYYSPEFCRFISPDSIEYLETSNVNGLNLYCYCGNNPVMYCDPSGHMPKWLRSLCVLGGAILAVAAIAVVTVASGGSAVPVLVGAAIGVGVSASVSVAGQLISAGSVDFGTLMTDIAIGGVSGAFGGSALGLLGMTISGAGTGFAGSIAGDFVSGSDINLGSAIWSGVLGGAIGLLGGAGAQHGKLGGVAKYTARLKTIHEKGITGRYLSNTTKYLTREKAILVSAANKAIYKSIPYTTNSTILDFII